jgi:hypothetical protein
MTQSKLLTQTPTTRAGYGLTGSVRASAQPLWAWVAVWIPAVLFMWGWQYYAVNVPKWDDHALRAYLYFFDQETTLSGKIYQLFKQHNEHRIVYDRLIATLDYWLFGKFSYVHLMVVGNLSLAGLLLVFCQVLRRQGQPLIWALPVSLLLFNLSHWENMFWGMAALQNFSVVFWVILTLYLISYRYHWSLALITAVLATLTSGNGLLVWPIGLGLTILGTPGTEHVPADKPSGKSVRRVVGWLAAAAVVIALYFIGFEKPAGNPPDRGSFSDLLKGWLAFTGAAAEALPLASPLSASLRLGGLMVLAAVAGIGWGLLRYRTAIGAAMLRLVRPRTESAAKEIPPVELFFWGSAAFILGTAAIVAWTRTGFGIDLIITSRYKIYSLLLLALLYIYALLLLPQRLGWLASVAGTTGSLLLAWLSVNTYMDETIWWRQWMLTSQFNWTYGTNKPVGRLDEVTKKYTNPAPAFYDTNPAVLYQAGQLPVVPVTVTQTGDDFTIENKTLPVQDRCDSRSFIVARSAQRAYLIPTRQHQQAGLTARFWPASPFATGFTAVRGDVRLDAGTYRLFVLTVAPDGSLSLHPTGKSVTSAGETAAALKKNW